MLQTEFEQSRLKHRILKKERNEAIGEALENDVKRNKAQGMTTCRLKLLSSPLFERHLTALMFD